MQHSRAKEESVARWKRRDRCAHAGNYYVVTPGTNSAKPLLYSLVGYMDIPDWRSLVAGQSTLDFSPEPTGEPPPTSHMACSALLQRNPVFTAFSCQMTAAAADFARVWRRCSGPA